MRGATWLSQGRPAQPSALFVWGLGAALIYARQRRLLPLVVAHFCTNVFFSLAPLVIFFMA